MKTSIIVLRRYKRTAQFLMVVGDVDPELEAIVLQGGKSRFDLVGAYKEAMPDVLRKGVPMGPPKNLFQTRVPFLECGVEEMRAAVKSWLRAKGKDRNRPVSGQIHQVLDGQVSLLLARMAQSVTATKQDLTKYPTTPEQYQKVVEAGDDLGRLLEAVKEYKVKAVAFMNAPAPAPAPKRGRGRPRKIQR